MPERVFACSSQVGPGPRLSEKSTGYLTANPSSISPIYFLKKLHTVKMVI